MSQRKPFTRFIFHFLLLTSLMFSFSIAQAADLSLNVSASPATAFKDQELTYTISVFPVRVGASRVVNDAVLSYGVPQNFTVVSATPSQGTCTAGSIIECEMGDLSGVQTIIIVVIPTAKGNVTSSVFASGLQLDADTGEIVTTTTNVTINTLVTDPPPITLDLSATTFNVTEGKDSLATVTVTRTGSDDRALSVDFTTEDGTALAGSDYETSSGTLVWTIGDTGDKSFTIKILDDRESERSETVNIILSNPVSATLGQSNAVLSIADDETTGVIEFSTVNYRVSEESGAATITVLRNKGSDTAITINYGTSNGTAIAGDDYQTASGTLFWSDNDTSAKTFEVPIIDDNFIEGDQTVTLILSAADEAVLGQRTATLTIVDEFTEEDAVAALNKVATNPTQRAMAQTVGTLCQAGQAGSDLQARCRELVVAAGVDGNAVANALQQLAPEEYAAQGRMAVEFSSRQFRNIGTRLMALRGGAAGGEIKLDALKVDVQGIPVPTDLGLPTSTPLPPSSLPSGVAHKYDLYPLGAFISGNISFGSRDDTDNESSFDFNSTGITAGLDYRFNDQLVIGVALGMAQGASDFTNGSQIDVDGFNFSVYSTYYEPEKYYIDGIFSLSQNDYSSKRNIFYQLTDVQVNQTASANVSGETTSVSISGGYNFKFNQLGFISTARFDHINVDIGSFSESVSSVNAVGRQLGLNIDAQNIQSTTIALGFITSYQIETAWAKVIPEISFEWINELSNDARHINGQFIHDASGQNFMVPTDSPDTSYFSLGFGLDLEYGKGQSAFIAYQNILGLSSTTYHSIMGGIKIEFD